MALVNYDNSDSSEFENDEDETTTVVTLSKSVEESATKHIHTNADEPENLSLFNLLPQPTNKRSTVMEEDDEFLHKNDKLSNAVKLKAKITVPSLSDFKDVEERPAMKPKISNEKKSGLLSMLPQPRNAVISTKSLIPHVLTKKPTATAKKKEPLPSVKKTKTDTKALVNANSDESDIDEEIQNDFFSMNKPETPLEDVSLDLDTPSLEQPQLKDSSKPFDIQSYFKQDNPQSEITQLQSEYAESSSTATEYYEDTSLGLNNGHEAPESSTDNAVLDDEAILKLCGSRGKRKREEIQILDVNQQEVLAEAREWYMKGLMDDTTKRVSASKKKGNEPTSQQKRKHQITYLAHQAKANEAELQNQWANNRMSRRQTQSKYGF